MKTTLEEIRCHICCRYESVHVKMGRYINTISQVDRGTKISTFVRLEPTWNKSKRFLNSSTWKLTNACIKSTPSDKKLNIKVKQQSAMEEKNNSQMSSSIYFTPLTNWCRKSDYNKQHDLTALASLAKDKSHEKDTSWWLE